MNTDSILIELPNPAPGTTATLRATIEDRGELVAEYVECAFCDGDPDSGGTLIGTVQVVSGTLIAGSGAEVSVAWDVPTFPLPHEIHVVADPALAFGDRDRGNNSATLRTILPDMLTETAWNDQVSYTSVALTARLANVGVIPTGAFDLSWRLGDANGPEIGRKTVDSIVAGGVREVAYVWDTAGQPSGAWVQVYAVADDVGAVMEHDETNNAAAQSVENPILPGDIDLDGDLDLEDHIYLTSDDHPAYTYCLPGASIEPDPDPEPPER